MTSTFDFLMVLYSIIIGISMAEILSAVGHVIQGDKPVKFYWVHTGWVLFIFLLHVFLWFSAWQYATIEVWTIGSFVMFLTIPVILYVASVIALPEIDPDRNYDMQAYYFRNYRWMHAFLVTIILLNSGNEYLLLNQYPFTIRNMARGAAAVILLVGLLFPKPFMHGIQISVLYALIGFFALTYRESIGG